MGDTWFAFQKAGVVPDMVTLSKTLSGGAVPISATLVGEHVYNRVFQDFKSGPIYFSTFAENNLAMAAGLATVETLHELDAPNLATDLSKKFRDGLMAIAEKYDVIERVAGHGLMIGVYFKSTKDSALLKVQQTILGAVDKGTFGAAVNVDMFTRHNIVVQIPGPGLNAIKILPPVNLKEEDVNYFLASFEETIANMYTRAGGPAVSLGRAAVKDAVKTVRSKVPGKSLTGKKPQPAGMTSSKYSDYSGPISDECDYLIIGSGPGGAIAAEQLKSYWCEGHRCRCGPSCAQRTHQSRCGIHPVQILLLWRYARDAQQFIHAHNAASKSGRGSVWNSAICLRPPQWCLSSGNKSMD